MTTFEQEHTEYHAMLSRDSLIDIAFGICFGVLGSVLVMAVMS